MKITILGLGNILLGDEGFGIHAVRKLKEKEIPGVKIIDGGTLGLYLINFLRDTTHLLIIDAIKSNRKPGTIVILDGRDIKADSGIRFTSHDVSLPDLLTTMELLGYDLKEIRLIGVVPERIEPTTDLSPSSKGAMERVMELVIRTVNEWKGGENVSGSSRKGDRGI